MLKRIILPAGGALVLLLAGCATVAKITTLPAPVVVGTAKITGSEETSALFDNFTVFVTAVNGRPLAAGRAGWSTPLEIPAGRNILGVDFNRGNFTASTDLELIAAADAGYEIKFTTDTKIFGRNSYCDFWIADRGTGQAVTPVRRAAVKKR